MDIDPRNLVINILKAHQNGSESILTILCNNKWRQLLREDNVGNTVLHIAALEGWYKVVESILKKCDKSRFGLDVRNCSGYTPLECADSSGKRSIRDLFDSIKLEEGT